MDTFVAMKTQLGLALAMLVAYLAGRRLWPCYAVVGSDGGSGQIRLTGCPSVI